MLILVFALLSLCFMRQCLMKNASSPYIWVLLIWCRVNELRGDEKIRLKVVLLFGSLVVRSGSWIRTFRSEKVLLIILSLKSNIESGAKNLVPNRKGLLSVSDIAFKETGRDPVRRFWCRQSLLFLSC